MRLLLVATLLLAGCSSARPEAWMLYSRASYLYGRIEAKAESVCAMQDPMTKDFCAAARGVQQEVTTLNPVIQAELTKEEPDWKRIMQYLDLVIGLAAKFVAVP